MNIRRKVLSVRIILGCRTILKVLDFSFKSSGLYADTLTLVVSSNRDAAHAYDHIPAGEHPAFHEIRALGAWLYEQQKFPQGYIQALMEHADEKTTKHYQEGHTEKEILYLEAGADSAF